eukprot:comp23809_c1_seq1/m.41421 comp23809_c1_seq1/g.41421  ORF comp23809_c1_seq1/g.41421 comp23809_c1_seq1/m.41421 type:complete len:865 (-) comp23809_c1_seq1:32-2626(-)
MARIYTSEMQGVLGPISQSIGDLLSFVEAAEEENVTLPDLTGPGTVILNASQGLAQAGLAMVKGKDPILDRDMPAAAQHLSESAQKVHAACLGLKKDLRSKVAKKQLEEGVRGILMGTTKILEIGDDAEVREMVAVIDEVLPALETLKTVTDADDLLAKIKPVAGNLVKVARQTEKRTKQLGSGMYREEIEQACSVVKTSTPVLISALRTYIQHSKDPASIPLRDHAISALDSSLRRIAYLIQLKFYKDEEGVGDGPGDVALSANEIFKALEKASLGQVSDPIQTRALFSDIDSYLQQANQIAATCTDHVERKALEDRIARAQQLREQMDDLTNQLRDDPSNEALKRQYASTAAALNKELADIQRLGVRALMRQKEDGMGLAKHETARLMAAAVAGDAAAVKASGDLVHQHTTHLCRTASLVAQHTLDGQRADDVRAASKTLEEFAPVLVAAATVAGNNPKDAGAQEHAKLMHKQYDGKLDALSRAIDAAIDEPGLAMAVNEAALSAAMPGLVAAAEAQDKARFEDHLAEVERRANRAAELAEHEASSTEDATTKAQLLARAEAMRKHTPTLLSAARALYASPKDAKTREALVGAQKALMTEVAGARIAIGGVDIAQVEKEESEALQLRIQKEKEDEERVKAEKEMQLQKEETEKRAKEEQERRISEAEEEMKRLALDESVVVVDAENEKKIDFVKDSEIGAAAAELHESANQWDDKENDVVAVAKMIAENFNKMAALANQPNSKRELIALSKEIASDAIKASREAQSYANNCADRKLKQQLLMVVNRMETIAAQLKIIATVKAAHYMDEQADSQLTICAKNLMDAVGASVGMCHSASLRPLAPNKDSAKWRKKVYRDRPEAKW